jgi:hypothetical protein
LSDANGLHSLKFVQCAEKGAFNPSLVPAELRECVAIDARAHKAGGQPNLFAHPIPTSLVKHKRFNSLEAAEPPSRRNYARGESSLKPASGRKRLP